MTDEELMRHALTLAKKGEGFVNPHPTIGAVIAKDGRIIGEGYYTFFGAPGAEREAIANCTELCAGATLYLTHFAANVEEGLFFDTKGVIAAGIKRLVLGINQNDALTPDLVALHDAGIEIESGVCAEECRAQNKAYIFWREHHRPYIVIQYSMTLDGKIATKRANNEDIICPETQAHVARRRSSYSATMLGVSAAIDDADFLQALQSSNMSGSLSLTVEDGAHQPLRVIFDRYLELPIHSELVQSAKTTPLLICTTERDHLCYRPYLDRGCEILYIPRKGSRDQQLQRLMERLGERGITNICVEGGAELHGMLFESGLVDHIECYLTPKILSGKRNTSPIKGLGTETFESTFHLDNFSSQQIGEDLLIECDVVTTFSDAQPQPFKKH